MIAWELDAAAIRALALDELAIRILADARANSEWNYRNWLLGAQQSGYDKATVRVLAEAWEWLRSKGLIAWNPEQSSEHAFFITRRGHEILASGLARLRAIERLDLELHPLLEEVARPQVLRGDLASAVFASFKAVEVRVRELANARDQDIGVALMRLAFKVPDGPLAEPGLQAGKAEAEGHLFAGAVGYFKNPNSHRDVIYEDPTLAVEAVLLADLLLRLLDRRGLTGGS